MPCRYAGTCDLYKKDLPACAHPTAQEGFCGKFRRMFAEENGMKRLTYVEFEKAVHENLAGRSTPLPPEGAEVLRNILFEVKIGALEAFTKGGKVFVAKGLTIVFGKAGK